ncbi:MAG: GTP-binding protein [Alphaproteobacteria bacterium]|nr:GTP-binding protein [Alphaproteobacteria bacterium]
MTTPGLTAGENIPVSLLTGFLGSGKTTVLNHLLQCPELSNTVVVINEFGEIGLDHELIESSTEDLVLLKSGCLCCTIRGDLIDVLRSLAHRRAHDEITRFDRVVIETTGLADPAPILHTLMTDPVLAQHYRLEGVITVVDAAVGMATLDRQIESVKQAAVADRLLLTKTDLVDSETRGALVERLKALNPAAPVIQARGGIVNPARLFDTGLYNPATKSLDVRKWLNAEAFEAGGHHHGQAQDSALHRHDHGATANGQAHAHAHHPNRHDDHIRAVCLTVDDPIDGDAFDGWLEALLVLRGPDILRVKGIVNIRNLKGPLVFHGVQHVFHPPIMLKKWPGGDRRTRIVFIVRDMSESGLRETLAMFTSPAAAPVMPRVSGTPEAERAAAHP